MKQGWFKAIVAGIVLAACVFSFAAGLTATAEKAQAAVCNCFDCWTCLKGNLILGECVVDIHCGPGGPCCIGPPPIE